MDLSAELSLLRQGDKLAFERIYKEFHVPVFTIILRIVHNRAESEELLQEVFLKLYQSPPPKTIANPRAYLFQMAHHLAIDHLRQQRPTTEISANEHSPTEFATQVGHRLDLTQALAKLSSAESQIVTLHLNAQLKFREIAPIVGLPLGTVLWKYQRALGRLRALLQEE